MERWSAWLRPVSASACLQRAWVSASHAPVALGRVVRRCASQLSLRPVDDSRDDILALQMDTPSARLHHLAAEWAGELHAHLHLPLAEARQPIAGGLCDLASAQLWETLCVPLRCPQHTHLAHTSRTHISNRTWQPEGFPRRLPPAARDRDRHRGATSSATRSSVRHPAPCLHVPRAARARSCIY